MIDAVNPPGVWSPFGAFSMAVIQGDGQVVHLKGQVSLDQGGQVVGTGDMRPPTLPPFSPRHVEERLRLLATGFQNAALAVLLGVLILPAFSGSPVLSFPVRLGAFVIAGIAESLALILLRYIPQPQNP